MSSRFRWLRDPRLPGAQLLLVARVGEREHRLGVLDSLEAVQRRGADPLGGRVWGAQLGVIGLDRTQLVEQRVVLVVADLGVVEDVVAAVVVLEQAAQLSDPLRVCLRRGAHAVGALAASISSKPQPRSRSRPPWSVRSKWIGVTEILPSDTARRSVPASSSNPGCQP